MTVVATYTLTNQCGPARPFCRPCTNSFTVITCGPTQCDVEPPSVICLKPKLPGGLITGNCWQFPDCGATLPAAYLIDISWGAIDPTVRTPGTGGSISFVLETLYYCGLYRRFESNDYPIPGVLFRPAYFIFKAGIGVDGFGAQIEYINGGEIVYTDNFRFTEDWIRLKYPGTEFGELCVDANHDGVASYVPKILFGSPEPSYPISIRFTPLTEEQ